MMRHELYLENSYVSELETVIENINEFGVKLKNTIFIRGEVGNQKIREY